MSEPAFKKYLNMLPVSWQRLLSSGLSWYIKRQEPEEVELKTFKNGYRIEVKTDEQNVEEFVQFWVNHVKPKLGDSDE